MKREKEKRKGAKNQVLKISWKTKRSLPPFPSCQKLVKPRRHMQIYPYSPPLPVRPANVLDGLLCSPHVCQPGQESLPDSLHFLHATALATADPLDECPDADCRGNGVAPGARGNSFILPHLDLDEGFDGWLGDGLARLN